MGLDAVELILEVEEAFSVRIPDREAERMLTVGDLFEYLAAQINPQGTASVCLSAAVFYSIRKAVKGLGNGKQLSPQSPTAGLLPMTGRRAYWQALQSAVGYKLPKLQRIPQVVSCCAVTVVAFAVAIALLAIQAAYSPILVLLMAITAGLIAAVGLDVLTRPFAVHPGVEFKTLRGLAEATLALNFKSVAKGHGGFNRADLWIALRAIIVQQLGVAPDEVKPTANFVDDLGCG